MDDARGVHRAERVADLDDDGADLLGAQRTHAPQEGGQRFPLELLHHQIRGAVGEVIVLEHLHDVRVPGETERLRLAPQVDRRPRCRAPPPRARA